MSENGKSEYCCSVVRISELQPIEGSDFLAKTNVFGTQIVVRKDMVHEGDIMFYASNETALNDKFLSVNNLYEIGCRDMNANADEVNAIMKEYEEKYKNEADRLRNESRQIKSKIDGFESTIKRSKKKIQKLKKDLEAEQDEEKKIDIKAQINDYNDKIDKSTKLSLEKTVVYTNLKKQVETLVNEGKPIVDKAKKLCGFFNKYGRVRCITLKGVNSFGFLFEKDAMARYNPAINDVNLEDYIDKDFDTVDGELFVKAYIPPVKQENVRKSKSVKMNKKISRFDRMINGEFSFLYDTLPLVKSMSLMSPDKTVTVSVKIHGTSAIFAKVRVKNPLPMNICKKLWNRFIDALNLTDKLKFKYDYTVDYGPVYSSRKCIKNQYINENVTEGYYGADLWTEWGDIVYPYIEKGLTVYGEIYGYVTGTETMIQKHYVYDCGKGENKFMPYRITHAHADGTKTEYNVNDVYLWTMELIRKMKENGDENWKRIHPIDILYHGEFRDMYPDVELDTHWHENVLDKMKNDSERFGMEKYEPLCLHDNVPREGIVIRIDDDPVNEAFKLKTESFTVGEALMYDNDNYQDIEVQEGNY